MNTKKNLICVFATLLAVGMFAWVFNIFINGTVSRVTITAALPINTVIVVSSIGKGGERIVDRISVTGSNNLSSQEVTTKLLNTTFQKLALSFYSAEESEKINGLPDDWQSLILINIQIERPYARDIFIGKDYTLDYFESKQNDKMVQNRLGLTQPIPIINVDKNLSLVSREIVSVPRNFWYSLSLTLIFAIVSFLLLRHIRWLEIPAFSDISLGRDISSMHEFGTINGLRGIAAVLVLMSHTAPGFEAIQVGIAILFVISGFLLSKPFILQPNKIFDLHNFETYLVKRLKRILPMYWLYIFITYVVTMQIDVAMRHFLFIQAEGHLWPMTQIFAFYMLLPFILLFTSILYKHNRILPIIALSIASYFWLMEMREWQPFYNGHYFHEFFLYAFLMGVLASYIQYGFIHQSSRIKKLFSRWSSVISIAGIVILALTIAWSAPVRPPAVVLPHISQFYVKCLCCVAVILIALNTHGTFLNKIISSWMFRSIGVVGFSFYLLHGLGMQIVLSIQTQLLGVAHPSTRSWEFMLMAFIVTYLMSIAAYSYIERPFFGVSKSLQ